MRCVRRSVVEDWRVRADEGWWIKWKSCWWSRVHKKGIGAVPMLRMWVRKMGHGRAAIGRQNRVMLGWVRGTTPSGRWCCGVAESFVFWEWRNCTERLATLDTLDLHATVCVHPLVTTQIWKLRVGLEQEAQHKFPSSVHRQKQLYSLHIWAQFVTNILNSQVRKYRTTAFAKEYTDEMNCKI